MDLPPWGSGVRLWLSNRYLSTVRPGASRHPFPPTVPRVGGAGCTSPLLLRRRLCRLPGLL
eukprot:5348369-Pyramimonas_sp.AAC.1